MDIRSRIESLGKTGLSFAESLNAIVHLRVDFRDVLYQTYYAATTSIGIVLVACSFVGLALSLEIAKEMVMTYGANRFVGGMVGLSIVREIGPIITAVGVAGNVGSAIAAELASMAVTEQVDALKVFGLPHAWSHRPCASWVRRVASSQAC